MVKKLNTTKTCKINKKTKAIFKLAKKIPLNKQERNVIVLAPQSIPKEFIDICPENLFEALIYPKTKQQFLD